MRVNNSSETVDICQLLHCYFEPSHNDHYSIHTFPQSGCGMMVCYINKQFSASYFQTYLYCLSN